jgi:hypothetical protein
VDPKRSPPMGRRATPPSPSSRRQELAATAGGGAAAAPPKPPTLTESIDRLAADVQRLRVDFERFFSGVLPFPPEDLRSRVQAQLRGLRNFNGGSAVDRFRLSDLEARYNSYNELFIRRVRDLEEGRRRTAHTLPAAPAPAPAPAPRYDPEAGIVIGRQPRPEAVEALYRELTAGGGGGAAGPRFDLASFGSYLERQAAAIRERTGCDEVQFRLAAEDGKWKLKARPVGRARSAG